jgi:hypothetical protein
VPAHNTPFKPGRREALLIAIAKARNWIDEISRRRSLISFWAKVTRSTWRSTRPRSLSGQLLAGARRVEVSAQRSQYDGLKLGCGNAAERCRLMRFLLQHGLGGVITDSARRPCLCASAPCGCRTHQRCGQSGARASPATDSVAPPPGRQACPAPPQATRPREWAHAHRGEHGPSPILKATDSHRVLRDHVRKDQLSVTRCTVHPSHSLAARPPIVASIEHFHPHPEVTRYGDELVVLIWLWREDLTMQAPYARTYCPRKSATTRLRRPGATTCSSCTVDACLIRGAACMGMGGVSVSRPSLMNTTRRSEPWHPEEMNVWCSTPRAATVSSGTQLSLR